MEERANQKMSHRVFMTDRKKIELTGITDVISFDLNKVVLESEYGLITIKGSNLLCIFAGTANRRKGRDPYWKVV